MTGSADYDPDAGLGDMRGRRVIITGAAGGIGRSTAMLFAKAGAALSLLDLDEAGLISAAREAGAVDHHVVDVTDEEQVDRAVEKSAAAMVGMDGVVNIAGINPKCPVEQLTLKEWRKVIDVNLTGTFLVCRAAMAHLRRAGKATVVNMGSSAALVPWGANAAAYNSAKGGIIAFTKAIAFELGPNIRANVICPGGVDTELFRSKLDQSARTMIAEKYALKRIAQPDEIAQAILFLSSNASSFMTGAALTVDGGRSYH